MELEVKDLKPEIQKQIDESISKFSMSIIEQMEGIKKDIEYAVEVLKVHYGK